MSRAYGADDAFARESDGRSGYTIEPAAEGERSGENDHGTDQKRGASPFLQAWGQAAHRRQAIAICRRHDARMECKSSGSVVCSCRYHVVFCPKCRRPVLVDGVDGRLREIALEVADEMGFEIIEMEAMPGHVHMLLEVDPQLGIHRAVKRIKGRPATT